MGTVDTSAWEHAGLYKPESPGATERLALLEYLTERGATIEQMVEAHNLGGLPGVAGQLIGLHQPPPITIEELAARRGTTPEMVQRILLAAGLPADAQGRVPGTLDPLVATFLQGASIMGEEAILAFTRVLGAASTNIAEAAVALFYSELGPGSGREGTDELARAHMSERATLAFTAVPEALSRVLLAQFDRAVRRAAVVRGPAWMLETEEARDSEMVALGFVDLVGSTAWAEGLDLRDQSMALARFESDAWSSAVLAGGRVVKMIGDEAFFVAPTVDAACRIALEVCRAVENDGLLPPARAAVGRGVVTSREGDYFGPVVNLVSRLVKAAAPGSVLVTADAAGELTGDGWRLPPLAPLSLRGVEQPIEATEVTASTPAVP